MNVNTNKKRSVMVGNRRTSISMEDSFWFSLQAIVRMERTTIEAFIEKVSRERPSLNLSSSLRVAVLEHFQHMAASSLLFRADDRVNAMAALTAANGQPIDQRRLLDLIATFWRRMRSRLASNPPSPQAVLAERMSGTRSS